MADLNLLIQADPAEPHVLVLLLDPQRAAEVPPGLAAEGLQRTGLEPLVVADRLAWQAAETLVAIPWAVAVLLLAALRWQIGLWRQQLRFGERLPPRNQ
jgi:hypothetical protein